MYNIFVMKLSVIFPCKNQSAKLLNNLPKVIEYFDNVQGLTYDILIQSDHSTDEQNKIMVEGLKKFPPHVKLLPLPSESDRAGKGAAVRAGILASQSDYCLFMDCDLATDLHVFDQIYKDLGKYDCYSSSRDIKNCYSVDKNKAHRSLVHKLSKFIIRTLFRLKDITDTQCGYKCFKTKVAKAMAEKQIVNKFAFDVEYLYFLTMNGFKIKEYAVDWENDDDSSVSLFSASKDFYIDLLRIKFNKKKYKLNEEEKAKLC